MTWEAIQRIELCDDDRRGSAPSSRRRRRKLGCDADRGSPARATGRPVFAARRRDRGDVERPAPVSGPSAIFRLSSGQDLLLTVSLHQDADSTLAADIAFRFLQRLSLATAERLERLLAAPRAGTGRGDAEVGRRSRRETAAADAGCSLRGRSRSRPAPVLALSTSSTPRAWQPLNWLRMALGWEARDRWPHHPSLGEE